MLKVGDKVRIVDDGEIYSTYFSWIAKNFDYIKHCLNHYVFNKDPSEKTVRDSIWTIIHIEKHMSEKDTNIAFIDNGNEAYMIGCDGIEEVESVEAEKLTTEKLLAEAVDIIIKHHELSKMEDDFLERIENR